MMLIRPVQKNDLTQLIDLAEQAGTGLTTLTRDESKLIKRIESSQDALGREIAQPGPESYLFVLEDTQTQQLVGTSGLIAAVGMEEAFYTYKVGMTVHSSPELGIVNRIDTLYLGNDYTGSTEICTLFLAPNYRKNDNGKLLSKCRFLFMADHSQRFAKTVIAEMRGYSDHLGRSPFWDSLGRHFFSMDFSDADKLSGLGSNQFIAELMPKYPIYTNMLSSEARSVIGQVHSETRPALKMLQAEGFRYRNYVDIFDAGPTIESDIDNIRTLANSCVLPIHKLDTSQLTQKALISNMCLDFKATLTEIGLNEEGCTLSIETAELLEVKTGDSIRIHVLD
ncbi:MAG: arginine N-succinyltransferase [Pseudomonadota bacterium]